MVACLSLDNEHALSDGDQAVAAECGISAMPTFQVWQVSPLQIPLWIGHPPPLTFEVAEAAHASEAGCTGLA